jgi:hypothetical protein
MNVTEKTVKVISGHFMFRDGAARDFWAGCNRLGLTSFPGDAMAEHGCHAPTLKRQGLYPCEAEIARRLSRVREALAADRVTA